MTSRHDPDSPSSAERFININEGVTGSFVSVEYKPAYAFDTDRTLGDLPAKMQESLFWEDHQLHAKRSHASGKGACSMHLSVVMHVWSCTCIPFTDSTIGFAIHLMCNRPVAAGSVQQPGQAAVWLWVLPVTAFHTGCGAAGSVQVAWRPQLRQIHPVCVSRVSAVQAACAYHRMGKCAQ